MRKSIMTLLGFLLFLFGFISIVPSMIGVQFAFLTWMDQLGRLTGFILRMVMILAGIVLVALAQTNWEKERLESS